LLQHLVTPS